MVKEDLVKKYAHCETYCNGSDEYRELDAMTDMQITELQLELEKHGFFLTYNNVDDCYCIC